MAPNSTILLFFILIAMFISSANADDHSQFKETNMSLYLQDVAAGSNATVIPVAGAAGKLWTFTQFGTLFVSDDPITEGPESHSAPVGGAQGIFATSSSDGRNARVMLSIVFANNAYNGSTLEIQGTSKQFDLVREVAVVSGTGKFRFARGYATFENYFMDIPSSYTVIRCKVSIFRY